MASEDFTPEQARHEVLLASFDDWNIPIGMKDAFAALLADYDRLAKDHAAIQERCKQTEEVLQWNPIQTVPLHKYVVVGAYLDPGNEFSWCNYHNCSWDGNKMHGWPAHYPPPTHWFPDKFSPGRPDFVKDSKEGE